MACYVCRTRACAVLRANVDFFDQPLSNRLKGRYEIITVRSVARWLESVGALAYREVIEPPRVP